MATSKFLQNLYAPSRSDEHLTFKTPQLELRLGFFYTKKGATAAIQC